MKFNEIFEDTLRRVCEGRIPTEDDLTRVSRALVKVCPQHGFVFTPGPKPIRRLENGCWDMGGSSVSLVEP